MKKHWSLFLALVALLAWPFAAQAQPPQFSATVTYNETLRPVVNGSFGRVAYALIQLNARLPLNIDPRTINETTALWLDFGAFGQDVLFLGMDSEYVRGTNRARITSPGISLDLSWTKANLTIAGSLIAQPSWPRSSPTDGVPGPFSGQDSFYAAFGNAEFVHAFDYHGTNTVRSDYSNSGRAYFYADLIPPVITIRAPRVVDAADTFFMTVSGTDNIGLAALGEDYDGKPTFFQLSAYGEEFFTINYGGNPATFPVALNPGTNVLAVRAQDQAGNYATNTITVFCSQKFHLEFAISPAGAGSASGLPADLILEEGRKYTVTARPAPGKIFAGWYGPVCMVSTSPTYTFTMRPYFTLRAEFVDNPFPAMAGNYRTAFQPVPFVQPYFWSDAPERKSLASGGIIDLAITKSGAFSGKMRTIRGDLPLSGAFDYYYGGHASFLKRFTLANGETINLNLGLRILEDTNDYRHLPSGTLSVDFERSVGEAYWYCAGIGSRVGSTADLAAAAGVYNFNIPNWNFPIPSLPEPAGASFGTFSLRSNGVVSGVIYLADNSTPVLFGTRILNNGSIPVFTPLYDGRGILLCNFHLGSRDQNIANMGLVHWIRMPNVGRVFTNGFCGWELPVDGAKWQMPALGASGTIQCWDPATGGAITVPLSVQDSALSVSFDPGCNLVFSSFNPTNGLFSGTLAAGQSRKKFSGICCGLTPDPYNGDLLLNGKGFCVFGENTGLVDLSLFTQESSNLPPGNPTGAVVSWMRENLDSVVPNPPPPLPE